MKAEVVEFLSWVKKINLYSNTILERMEYIKTLNSLSIPAYKINKKKLESLNDIEESYLQFLTNIYKASYHLCN